jgi:hypothetical protein
MRTLDKVFLIAGVMSLSIMIGVSSCENDGEENESAAKPTRQTVDSRLKGNKWGVVYFFDDKDETHLYSGYTFEFDDSGAVTATNINSSTSGVWSTFNSPNNYVKLNFEFSLNEPFDELNEDWVVTEITSDKITLEHAGKKPGETDVITLEKVNS